MKGIYGIKTALASLGQPSAWSMEKALQRESKKVEKKKGEAERQEQWRGHSCGYPRLLEEEQRKTRHSGKKGGRDGVFRTLVSLISRSTESPQHQKGTEFPV